MNKKIMLKYILIISIFTLSGFSDILDFKCINSNIKIPIDTLNYEEFQLGRPLSGINLKLLNNGTYEKNRHCDICPAYIIYGKYKQSGDTIFFNDSGFIAEKNNFMGRPEYSMWFDSINPITETTYKLYRWRVDNKDLIGPKKLNDSIARIVRIILKQNEFTQIDNLPYRKIK
ncbi:MAG: hypothetical protein H7321_04555 [Bacteroidia bacterium]|nr:hypothetical protein [Bacteroidia bacterium]